MTPLESLVACGTKLWLDSVDPDEVARNRGWGATGATSNPIIVADLIKTGRFDEHLDPLLEDPDLPLPEAERARRYVALGKQWAEGARNRMIKVPATAGGLAALE